jgi:hypothetical protein
MVLVEIQTDLEEHLKQFILTEVMIIYDFLILVSIISTIVLI